MTETGYNGRTNYETWVTALWIDNDQGSSEDVRYIVAGIFDDETDETPRVTAADALLEWVDEHFIGPMVEEAPAGLATDLLGHAFQQINWFEIVDTIRSEV